MTLPEIVSGAVMSSVYCHLSLVSVKFDNSNRVTIGQPLTE